MFFKKIRDGLERPGKILLITIQIGQDLAGCFAQAAVDRIVHSFVFLDIRFYPSIGHEPIQCSVVRARILHDVLDLDAFLIGDGRDTKLQQLQIPVARRDD
jgi:hypothetical protein